MESPSRTVLVIDADAASRNYLSAMLQKSGYAVLLASSAREGLITAWKDLPDIILIDPALADMPALTLVTRLRQEKEAALAEAAEANAHAAKLSEELKSLQAERKQVRSRIEKLLGQIDELSAG